MCGIIGVVGRPNVHVNQLIYDGLTVLQHRGQDAAGIMTEFDGQFRLRKSNGLVSDIFYTRHMRRLQGHVGIGHVRIPQRDLPRGQKPNHSTSIPLTD